MIDFYSKHFGVACYGCYYSFVSLTLGIAKLAFDVFIRFIDKSILDIQALVSCHLEHYNIRNPQSIAVELHCEDKMAYLSSWWVSSKIQALLVNDFFMKDVYLYIRFTHPLR